VNKHKKIAALVPAYNCGNVIGALIKELNSKNVFDFIIVIDDFSIDDTYSRASNIDRVHVFRNSKNLGYGGTSIELYKKARELGADYTVNFHGDGGHRVEAIYPLICELKKGKADIVIGSRLLFLKRQFKINGWRVILDRKLRGNMPLVRLAGHLSLTYFQNKILNLSLNSYHEGMRGCSATAINWILSQQLPSWYQFDNMLLSLAAIDGLEISEISCKPNYAESASSSAPPFKYGIAVLSLIHNLKKRPRK
jgi:glycosyltransferase involved in cell wall biosynthesis